MRFLCLTLVLLLSSCDSSEPVTDDVSPTGPAGTFALEPVHFEVDVVESELQGFFANYQGWIEGDITLTETGGVLSGQGTCTWKRRTHRSWLGETNVETGSQRFTAKGTLVGGRVTLDLQGCAWVMVRHTGTFDGSGYDLRIPDTLAGPLFPPTVWEDAHPSRGTDPFVLVLSRP